MLVCYCYDFLKNFLTTDNMLQFKQAYDFAVHKCSITQTESVLAGIMAGLIIIPGDMMLLRRFKLLSIQELRRA